MLAIIMKDCYESFCIKKNMLSGIFSLLCLIWIIYICPNVYGFILLVGFTIPMLGMGTIQYAMEQDEISGFDKVLLTYPMTRIEIIKAKFLELYVGVLIYNLLLSLPSTIYYYSFIKDFNLACNVFFFGLLLSLVINPIYFCGFLAFGNKKGTILYVLTLGIIVAGYVLMYFGFGFEEIILCFIKNWGIWMSLLMVVMNILAYKLAIFIYTKKHS